MENDHFKISLADVGGIGIELCQPVEGNSIYRDFLDISGEGLYHLELVVDDVVEAAQALNKHG